MKSPQDMKKINKEYCPLSKRVDGKKHGWHFDGDDPYVICCFCGEIRDAISDRVIKQGQKL